jgi:hypothetical protein
LARQDRRSTRARSASRGRAPLPSSRLPALRLGSCGALCASVLRVEYGKDAPTRRRHPARLKQTCLYRHGDAAPAVPPLQPVAHPPRGRSSPRSERHRSHPRSGASRAVPRCRARGLGRRFRSLARAGGQSRVATRPRSGLGPVLTRSLRTALPRRGAAILARDVSRPLVLWLFAVRRPARAEACAGGEWPVVAAGVFVRGGLT